MNLKFRDLNSQAFGGFIAAFGRKLLNFEVPFTSFGIVLCMTGSLKRPKNQIPDPDGPN